MVNDKYVVKYLDPRTGKYEYATVKDVGDLQKLNTKVKTSIVDAINSISADDIEGLRNGLDTIGKTIKSLEDGTLELGDFQSIDDVVSREIEDAINRLSDENSGLLQLTQEEVNKIVSDAESEYRDSIAASVRELETSKTDLVDAREKMTAIGQMLENADIDYSNLSQVVDDINLYITDVIEKTDFDMVNGIVSDYKTAVTQTKDGWGVDASKNMLSYLTGRVKSNETSLDVQHGLIQAKVGKDEFQYMTVDNLPAGKENMLHNTSDLRDWNFSSAFIFKSADDYRFTSIVQSDSAGENIIGTTDELEQGVTYAISAYVNVQNKSKNPGEEKYAPTDGNYTATVIIDGDTIELSNVVEDNSSLDGWKRVSGTFIAKRTAQQDIKFYVTAFDRNTHVGYLSAPKLEKGSAATSWIPHIEDNVSTILSQNAVMRVLSDRITSSVEEVRETKDAFETATSTFDQMADGFALNTNKLSEVLDKYGEVTGVQTEQASELKVLNESITSKVWKQDINTTLDTINIDTSNRIVNSAFNIYSYDEQTGALKLDYWDSNTGFAIKKHSQSLDNYLYATRSNATSVNPISIKSSPFALRDGEKILFNFEYLAVGNPLDNDNVFTLEMYDNNDVRVGLQEFRLSELKKEFLTAYDVGDSYKYNGTYIVKNSSVVKGTITLKLPKNGELWLTKVMLQNAGIGTIGWTPSSIDNQIIQSKLSTEINQLADSIELVATDERLDAINGLLVKKDGKIVISPEAIISRVTSQELLGDKALISQTSLKQTEDNLRFDLVDKEGVIQTINASAEGLLIDFDKVHIDGEVIARMISAQSIDATQGFRLTDNNGNTLLAVVNDNGKPTLSITKEFRIKFGEIDDKLDVTIIGVVEEYYYSVDPDEPLGGRWTSTPNAFQGGDNRFIWKRNKIIYQSGDISYYPNETGVNITGSWEYEKESVTAEVVKALDSAEAAKELAVSEANQAMIDANKYADEQDALIREKVDTSVSDAISKADQARQVATDSYNNAVAKAEELTVAQSEAFNKKFEETSTSMDTLSQAASDADAKAQDALDKAGANSLLLDTHQDTLNTINEVTIPNINTSISDVMSEAETALSSADAAMAEALKTDGKIATFKESIEGTISDVNDTAQSALEEANKTDGKIATAKELIEQNVKTVSDKATEALSKADTIDSKISNVNTSITDLDTKLSNSISTTSQTLTSQISTASSKAQQALDEANKADGKIADYVTRNGLVSGTTVDNKINTATGEISKKITTVEGKIDGLQVGGRNFILNSGEPLIPRGVGNGGITASTTEEGYLQVVAEPINGNYFYFTQLWDLRANGQIINNFKQGDDLTFSIDIKSPDSTDIPTLYVYGSGNIYRELVGVMDTEFSRFHLTVNLKDSPIPVNIVLGIAGKTGTFIFRNPKIEKGNIATDYSPAPEDNYTKQEFSIFESTYDEDVKGINSTLTELTNKKLDGTTYTDFYENDYKRTAKDASDAFTAVNKIVSEDGTVKDVFSKAVYEQNASRQSSDFNEVTKDLVRTATYESGIDGVSQSITRVEGKVDDLSIDGINVYQGSRDLFTTDKRFFNRYVQIDIWEIPELRANIGKKATLSFDIVLNEGGVEDRVVNVYHYQNSGLGIGINKGIKPTREKTRYKFTGEILNKPIPTGYSKGSIFVYDLTGVNDFTVSDIKIEIGEGSGIYSLPLSQQYTQSEFSIFENNYNEDVKGINSTLTELSNKKLDGSTYTDFYENSYKKTAKDATDAYTAVNRIVDADGNSTENFAKAVYERNAQRQKVDFESATEGLLKTAIYEEGIDGIKNSLSEVEGKIPTSVGGRNYLLNSGKPGALTLSSNNGATAPMTRGIEDGIDWITQSNADGFTISTYVYQHFGLAGIFGNTYSKDLQGYEGDITYSVDVMSAEPITIGLGAGNYRNGDKTTLVTNKWTRISITLPFTEYTRPLGFIALTDDNREIPLGTKLYWKNYKIEKGNVATDYSLAPEDTLLESDFKSFQADYELNAQGITSRLSTAENNIKTNNTAFTTFKENEYKRTAERVSDTFTKQETTTMLGDKADASQLSNYLAKSTYERDAEQSKERFETIESDLDNISVGGRNLFSISKVPVHSRLEKTENTLTFINSYANNLGIKLGSILEVGEKYTISFKVKLLSGEENPPGISGSIRFYDHLGESPIKQFGGRGAETISETFVLDSISESYTIYFYGSSTGVYELKDIKIEKGTIATDWTPAVEDMANISYVSSEVTKSAEAIKSSLANYAKTTDLNGLATETYATNQAVSEAGKVKNELTKYAKTTDLTGLASETYATNVAVNEATKVSNELTKYAKTTDLTGLATETYAQTQATTEAGKVEQKLTGYAKTTDLNGLATETYATNKAIAEAGKVSNELAKYELKTGVDSKISTASSALRIETAEKMKTVYTKTETETLLGKKADSSTLNNYVQTATYNEGIDGVSQSLVRVEGKVDGLQVGGRNLIKRSDFGNIVLSGVSSVVVLDEDYQNGLKATGGNNGRVNYIEFPNVLDGNGWYTVSFLARGTQNGTRGLSVVIGGSPALTDGRISNTSNEYTYHTYSYKVENYNSETNNSIKIAELDYAYYRINNIKLEKGNKATDWTPAPEDTLTQDEYKTFKSSYESTVQGISGQITSLSTNKLDGNTYTNFLANDYKATADKATSAFTKVDKIVDASGNVKDNFSKAVYDQNATRQSADFKLVTDGLVKEATYTAGINGINSQITTVKGKLNDLSGARNLLKESWHNSEDSPAIINTNYGIKSWELENPLELGKTYTFRLFGFTNREYFTLFTPNGMMSLAGGMSNGDSSVIRTGNTYNGLQNRRVWEKTFTLSQNQFNNMVANRVVLYNYPSSSSGNGEVYWATLVEGNAGIDWSPAISDQLGKAEFEVFKNTYESTSKSILSRLTAIDSSEEGSVVTRLNKTESTASGNSQLIATINSNYVKQANIDASILADKKIKDTRSTNQLPSWYFSNYPSQEVREFKQVSTMGIGSGSYGILTTNVPWTGSSGGTVKQTFETNEGIHTRQGNAAATAWGAWVKQIDTADATYQKVTQTSELYERVLGSTSEYGVKNNISSIVQTSGVIQQTITSAMNVENRNLLITKNATNDSWLTGNEGYPNPSLQADSGTSTSPDLIEVKNGDKFTLSKNETTLYFRISFLNSSKTYIGRYVQNAKLGTIVPPSGTAYMWVSYPTNADAKVEKGEIATGYSLAPEDSATVIRTNQIENTADYSKMAITNLSKNGVVESTSVNTAKDGITERVAKVDANGNISYSNRDVKLNSIVTSVADANYLSQQIQTSDLIQSTIKSKTDISKIGNAKTFTNLTGYDNAVSSIIGYLIIRTPINSNNMVNVHIGGYNYYTNRSDIDIDVSFYRYNATSILNHSYSNKGNFDFGKVQVGTDSAGRVVIVLGLANTSFSYPKITVDKAIIGHGSVPDSYINGWTATISTDLTGISSLTNIDGMAIQSKVTQLSDSWSMQLKKADDVVTQINATSAGVLIQGKNIQLDGNVSMTSTFSVPNANIAGLSVDKITGTNAQFTTMITKGLTADVITSTMIKADTALFNMLFSTTSATSRLVAQGAWITNANIVSLDASKINAGTISTARLDSGAIVTAGLSANVVKSTHIESSTALVDKVFATTALIQQLTSKTAFISSIQAINISASRITSGTLNANLITVSNLSASSITGGTLDANKVTINNLSVGSLTGFDATFMRTKWNNATGGGVSISDEGVQSVASDNSQVLMQNGRTLYRNTAGATLGSMGYQDYGSSPYMTIQTSLGSHFRLSMRRDTLVGNSNDKHALTIMSGGYEMYLNTDKIYLTGDTTIQRGLSVYNNLSLSGGEINGTNRVRFAKGAYLEEQSTGNVQLKSAGTQLQFYQASGRIMYSEGTRLFLDLPINMQGNGVLNQSDARIKTDIRKIEQDSLSIIKGTDFVNYKMISNGRETFGFVAQQMQKVAPHLIKDEDGTLAFDSMEWTQTVAHGLQQLNNKVDENDNKMNNRIKELESKIEMLELELKRARG